MSSQSKGEPPLGPSWASLSAGSPSLHHEAESGRVQVWFPDRGGRRLGECSTLNTSECPNEGRVSSLSAVLEPMAGIQLKYYLKLSQLRALHRSTVGKDAPESLTVAIQCHPLNRWLISMMRGNTLAGKNSDA